MAKTIPQLTDATTVNAADELIIHQSGITKRATANEFLGGAATVTAAGTTSGRSLVDRFADMVSAKDFGAVGDGVTDDSAAIQAAVSFCSTNEKTLYVPAGSYLLGSRISVSSTEPGKVFANIVGDGIDTTIFTVSGSSNSQGAFYFYKNGPLLNVSMRGFSVVAKTGTGLCGTAIHIEQIQGGAQVYPGAILNDIFVGTEDSFSDGTGTPAYWLAGVKVIYSPRPRLENVTVDNPKRSGSDDSQRYADSSVNYLGQYGFEFSNCYAPNFIQCAARQYQYGFYSYQTTEAEGGTFIKCAAVNVKNGIHVDGNTSVSGVQPGLDVFDGHISFRDYGIYVNGRKGINVRNILFYHVNSSQGQAGLGIANPTDIYIHAGTDVFVYANRFAFDSLANRIGVFVNNFTAGTGKEPNLRVASNIFDATFLAAVSVTDYPNFEQFVEPEVSTNWFGFNVKNQIRIGSSTYKTSPRTQELMSDSFTPSVVSGTTVNIDSVTPQLSYFHRVGNIVNVWGRIGINATTTNTLTEFSIEPPIVVTVPIDSLESGTSYTISFVGTSNFVTVGASANTIGTVFTASGAGTGSGYAIRNTSLLSDTRASGVVTSAEYGTGSISGSSGRLKFSLKPSSAANQLFYFNASYVIE